MIAILLISCNKGVPTMFSHVSTNKRKASEMKVIRIKMGSLNLTLIVDLWQLEVSNKKMEIKPMDIIIEVASVYESK